MTHSFSFCLHTKVRLHLQIKIKKSNLYSVSIHSSFNQIILKHLSFHPAMLCPGIRLVHNFSRSFSLTFSLQDHFNSVLTTSIKCDLQKVRKPLSVCHMVSVHLCIKCLCVGELSKEHISEPSDLFLCVH